MNGMEMLLKSFGFDIEEIKQEAENTIKQLLGGIQQLTTAMQTVADNQKRMEAKIDRLMVELHVPDVSLVQHKPHVANGGDTA